MTDPQQHETILLVDDEPMVRSLVSAVLRRQGYLVLEAADAETALALCREHRGRIDLLMTDVVLETMGGPELAARVRDLFPEIPALFVSGLHEDSVPPTPRSAFVQKPFSLAVVVQVVRDLLDGRSSG